MSPDIKDREDQDKDEADTCDVDVDIIYREWRRGRPISDTRSTISSQEEEKQSVDIDKTTLLPYGRGGHCIVTMPLSTHSMQRRDTTSHSMLLLVGGGDRTGAAFGDVWEMEILRQCQDENTNICTSNTVECESVGDIVWRRARNQEGDYLDIPPRSGASSVCFESTKQIVIFGGQDPISGTCFNDTIILQYHERDNDSDNKVSPYYWSWRRSQPTSSSPSPPPRHSHISVCVSERLMILFGGASQSHGLFNDVWVFDIEVECWSLKHTTGSVPCAREMAAAAVIADPSRSLGTMTPTDNNDPNASPLHERFAIVVHGGRGDSGVLNDCVMLNLSEWSWNVLTEHVLSSKALFSRCSHCAIAMGSNRLLCTSGFDGMSISGEAFMIDVESSSHATLTALKSIQNSERVARFAAAGTAFTYSCNLSDDLSDRRRACIVGGVTESDDLADVLLLF